MTPPLFPDLDESRLVAALAALRSGFQAPPPPVVAALSASTGWPGRHAEAALRRAFRPFTDAALRRLVARGRPAGAPGASESPWLLAILAGRVPALAVQVVISAWAARVAVRIKPSSLEPTVATALVEAVARVAPELIPAIQVVDWSSDASNLRRALATAPLCLAYGSDATAAAVRAARGDLPTRFGAHRESAVVVFREALTAASVTRLAAAIARDVAIYDQSGCLSPQVVLVESGGTIEGPGFAAALADALARVDRTLPPATPDLADLAAVRLFAQEARMLGRRSGGRVFPDAGPIPPLVVFEPAGGYRPSPGHRCVQVLPFAGRPDLDRLLGPMSGRVQGLACAGPRTRLRDALAAFPAFAAPYVCAPGRLQDPPAGWAENGTPLVVAIREMVSEARAVRPARR